MVWSEQGLTCSQIQGRLVDEFGDGILASPPASGFGLLAWVLPLAGLALGTVVVGLLAWLEPEPRGQRAGFAAAERPGAARSRARAQARRGTGAVRLTRLTWESV